MNRKCNILAIIYEAIYTELGVYNNHLDTVNQHILLGKLYNYGIQDTASLLTKDCPNKLKANFQSSNSFKHPLSFDRTGSSTDWFRSSIIYFTYK